MTALTVDGFADVIRDSTKYGWIAKGLLYSGMGILGLSLGLRSWSTGEEATQNGALNVIAEQPFGRIVVTVVAFGLLMYSLWQLVQSIVGIEQDTDDPLSLLERIGAFGLSIFYLFLAIAAFELAIRGGSSGSGSGGSRFSPDNLARNTLQYPLGRWVVALVGIVTVGIGVYHLWKVYGLRFLDDLDDDLSPGMRRFGAIFGTYGMLARAGVLVVAGYLVIEAAWTFDPEKAGGFDQALRELAVHPAGTVALIVMAVGFIAAGLYDAVTYRHQTIE